jgi:site-specific recombinase XerD
MPQEAISSALVGCGPDPAKQKLLEQLVTTRSAITAGVTPTVLRDRVMVLLSFKAGLRAKEIAELTWSMVTDASGETQPM